MRDPNKISKVIEFRLRFIVQTDKWQMRKNIKSHAKCDVMPDLKNMEIMLGSYNSQIQKNSLSHEKNEDLISDSPIEKKSNSEEKN